MNDTELATQAWNLDAVSAYHRELALTFQKLRPRSDDAIPFAHAQWVNPLQRLCFRRWSMVHLLREEQRYCGTCFR